MGRKDGACLVSLSNARLCLLRQDAACRVSTNVHGCSWHGRSPFADAAFVEWLIQRTYRLPRFPETNGFPAIMYRSGISGDLVMPMREVSRIASARTPSSRIFSGEAGG